VSHGTDGARSPRHRLLLRAWFFLYAFVGIQMGWVLRPFIGDPHLPVAFFRSEAWGNAYVIVGKLVVNAIGRPGVSPLLWVWWCGGVLPLTAIFVLFYVYHVIRERYRQPRD
jgi:hypothetical protein